MIAIKGGKIVTVTNGIIENGTVLIDGSKIIGVGKDIEIPSDAKVIDAAGKWVTPGFIDAHTHISTFNEPNTLPAVYDGNEMSNPVTAHIRGLDALNPHDMAIEHSRKAGFTTCYTGPGSANVIGGTGISFKLKEGSTVYDLIIPGSEHMKMALGENPRRVYGSEKKMPMTRMGIGAVLRETLYNAKVYSDQLLEAQSDPSKAPKPDFKLEALVPAIRGEMKVRIHSHRADDIVTAIRIAKEFNLDFAIEHCTEGYKILDFLKENNVTAVVGPLTMGPAKMEIWGCKLETPGIMEKAGINFCLTEDTSSGTKYLPMHVGLCIARGLSEEAAFEAVTIRPAKLLGIDRRTGSIEAGKDADIAIFNGFPFSNLTLCETTIIDGEVYENLL
ncbi:amidohydrolase [Anaeropeptidivorans aminofermentans]|jgi:imidazolonepropionase-like amidohydrolase|uniref:amidohydrolase n=1 Tax=Anaeropeptidivorans aminofermentans TaxID=2934315 RepID=UPI0020250678|nr:amidohydrolase [Anaeropeptidivorans aminofermentans]MBE6011838.1 amidohydrolase [Lachnospiraceae bacterium]